MTKRDDKSRTTMYFSENPESTHHIKNLETYLLGEVFYFQTDSGVFSKNRIDFGSQTLINNADFEANKTLLDVGCGYGPIGISLSKVKKLKATMIDINNRALELAKENAKRNHVEASIFHSSLYEQVEGQFDYIVSNPPIRAGKEVVHEIIAKSIDYLNDNGSLTIVIQKKQGAPSAKTKMQDVFGNVDVLKKEKGYYILRSVKNENS
ncbi:class I SAM-dependent methyltransferase [Streptococcus pacificus]|uniref:Class I SAM-dependent methyltransferase n=1 Tax=Streptococcus pacificus TaxID=2740577 RepID=A0ABS0ZHV8_9STRE|nr:class I SAM-dependent methyltransferase [Streptococcus pacificus]MBJ8325580.1 class I SAM-dependent methyltransferase [Streptococcus pacificus]